MAMAEGRGETLDLAEIDLPAWTSALICTLPLPRQPNRAHSR
jgi:hypothetical protein